MDPKPASAAAPRPEGVVLPGEFERWVAASLNRRILKCLLGAVGCAIAAVAVLWLTWQAIYFTLWFILLSFSTPAMYVFIATWVLWVLLFVVYFAANRPETERSELEAPSKLRAARITAILTDSPYLALAGPRDVGSFVKVVSVVVLIGPGILVTAWKLLRKAVAGMRGSSEKVGQVLKTLATVGVRFPLEELMRSESAESLAPTFAALRLFDGVTVRTSDPVGLMLANDLRDEILKRLPPDQQRATVPSKAPPVRVSAPAKPGGTTPTRTSAAPPPKPKTAAPTKPSVAPPSKPMKPTSEAPPRRPKPPPR